MNKTTTTILIALSSICVLSGCRDSSSNTIDHSQKPELSINQSTDPLLKMEKIYVEDSEVPNQIFEYFYDTSNRLILITNKWLSEENQTDYVLVNTLSYAYNDNGSYTETVQYYTSDQTSINMYDAKGKEIYEFFDIDVDGKKIHTETEITYEQGEDNEEIVTYYSVGSDDYYTESIYTNEYGDVEDIISKTNDDGDESIICYVYEYDDHGNMLSKKQDGCGSSSNTTFEYDNSGRLIKEMYEDQFANEISEYIYENERLIELTKIRIPHSDNKSVTSKNTTSHTEYEYY